MIESIPLFFVPSFYGDIRVEPTGKKTCNLVMERLSPAEVNALRALEPLAHKKGWVSKDVTLSEGIVPVDAPTEKIAKIIAKALKPGREIVSAVMFSDGKMKEITEAEYNNPPEQLNDPYRSAALVPVEQKEQKALVEPTPKAIVPKAAAAVARPTLGCPAPDFDQADVKATRVLRTFLNAEQREDWDKYNRFITIGAVTGHRYMITSRYARSTLASTHRSLYDIDEQRAYCVHDWHVPPAEESLALHLLVQLPGHENYLRHLE